MATNFPTSIDSLTNPASTDKVSVVDHAAQHANANDAVEALETKVGVNGSAVTTTHDYKLSGVTGTDKAVSKTGTETLTNKTLTTPVIASIKPSASNTITLPDATDTVVGRATTDTLTNKTLTSPKVGTAITDTNGNEIIKTPATASAVNEITVTNAATGGAPQIDATGDDENIHLEIKAKGTGKVKIGTAGLQFPNADGNPNQQLKTDGSGTLSFVDSLSGTLLFGGTGADGALAITTGTTNIDLGGALVVVKNYTSISITGDGVLGFTNPHNNGTIIILKSQGNVTLTSTATPMIDGRLMGAQASGLAPICNLGKVTAAVNGGESSHGAGGDAAMLVVPNALLYRTIPLSPGGSGGLGHQNAGGNTNPGGDGGAAILIECGGAFNFTTASGVNVSGQSAAAGTATYGAAGAGAGGCFVVVYNTLTANTGSVVVAGGTGATQTGNGGGGGASICEDGTDGVNGKGGNGGDGYSMVVENTIFDTA